MTDQPETQPLVDRDLALDASGWGRTLRLYQPRNLAFWIYLLLVGFGIVSIFTALNSESPVYGSVIAVSIVLFGLYGGVFWWFTHRIERCSSQPGRMVVVAVLWERSGR